MLWQKLPDKEIDCKEYQKRVLEYDPSNVPNLFTPRPFQRHQPISILDLFPKVGNVCGCGCGVKLNGRKTRWATEDCQSYTGAVTMIIAGRSETIQHYLRRYYGWICAKCGCEDKGHEMGKNGTVAWIKVDHIIPVKLGGGACWLSNYQLLCHDCHVGKTNKDFNWKKEPIKVLLPSLFPS